MIQTKQITKLDEYTLNFFNGVLLKSKDINEENYNKSLGLTISKGYILSPYICSDVSRIDSIINYLNDKNLDGEQLNKTFHKSWNTILKSTKEELLAHQIMHYFSTYGLKTLDLFSHSTVYFPTEKLEVPKLDFNKLDFKVIKAYTKDELVEKCFTILNSGIALEQDKINNIFTILTEIGYEITQEDLKKIKNKEALCLLVDYFSIYPEIPSEYLRYLLYKATDNSLLIKNNETIKKIVDSKLNISNFDYDIKKLSSIFNRFKPLFIAFKKANKANISYINKISKLSKKYHKPLKRNYLDMITENIGSINFDKLDKALEKATPFQKIRILYALNVRKGTHARVYKIRNGRTFIKEDNKSFLDIEEINKVYSIIYQSLINQSNIEGKKIYYPKNVDYALPTSGKMFIENIPNGTKFNVGKNALFGIYWKNSGGATDLDLSSLSFDTKIGWNSSYKNYKNTLLFSGDITDAHNGASEYMLARNGLKSPFLIANNIYSGSTNCEFKIIIGKNDGKIESNYMINPNDVIVQINTKMNSRQESLGIFVPTKNGVDIILTKFSGGPVSVSGVNKLSNLTRKYIDNKFINSIYMQKFLKDCGAIITHDEKDFDIDLSVENINQESFLNLFK